MKQIIKKFSALLIFILMFEVALSPLSGWFDTSSEVQASVIPTTSSVEKSPEDTSTLVPSPKAGILSLASTIGVVASVYKSTYTPPVAPSPQAAIVAPAVLAPPVPQNLSASKVTLNEVVLEWDKGWDHLLVVRYEVFRNGVLVASVPNNILSLGRTATYTDSGLNPQTDYTYHIKAVDLAGSRSAPSSSVTVKTMADTAWPGKGIGVRAEYFSGTNFDQLKLRRLDQKVDFSWDKTLTDAGVNRNSFSVRWSGKIQAKYTENYTLFAESHGGVRLWVNGQLLIDRWNSKGTVRESTTVSLTAGQLYELKMEFHDDNGISEATLLWSSTRQSKEVVPTAYLYPPVIPGKPTSLQATMTRSSVALSWDNVPGAEGYDVEADGAIVHQGPETAFVHNGLSPYSQHTYRVRAKLPEIAGAWSDELNATTLVGVPGGFDAVVSEGTVTLSWETVTGATYYQLEIDGALLSNGSATTYVHRNLMPDTEHTYRVRALNGAGNGDWTALMTKTVLADIPTNVTAQSTARSILLNWDEVYGATGYDIEADGQVISTGMATTYSHLGLTPNTRHQYRVRAVKPEGAQAWSPNLYKSTLLESGHGTGLKGEYFNKENLTDLKTIRIDPTIFFDWKFSHPAPGINNDDFSVRWSGQVEPTFSEKYTFYTEAHGGARLWINNQLIIDNWSAELFSHGKGSIQLEAGKRYDLKMEYRETFGTSLAKLYWESPSQAKGPIPQILLYPIGVASKLTSSSSSETSITLNWEAASFAGGYEVEVDGAVIDNGAALTYTHTDLIPGTRHTYRVRAKSAGVIGEWSPALSETTKLAATSITNIIPTENTLEVIWEPVYGAAGYDIEVDGVITDNENLTHYLHDGLLSGTVHSYRVRAKTDVFTGPWSQSASKWTLPDVPQDIQVQTTNSSLSLSWSLVRGATGYDVEKQSTIMDNGHSVFYEDSGLNPNTPYAYRVRAKNSSGPGKWTSVKAQETLTATPDGLKVEATESEAYVTWGRVAGAIGYEIEVDGLSSESVTQAAYRHTSLLPNSTHKYRVRSMNEDGKSGWSSLLEATTLPPLPGNFKTLATDSNVLVSWSAVDGAASYDLEIDGHPLSMGTQTLYVHSALAPNTEHTYRIRAQSAKATGKWTSSSDILMPPGVPANVQTTVGSSSIEVHWDMVLGATGYELEIDGVLVDVGLNSSYMHTDIASNSPHSYRVRTRNAGGTSDWSVSVSQTTLIGKPQNLQTTATTNSITTVWEQVYGASGYDVFVDGEVVDNGSSLTFSHNGLAPYSRHVYRVRAKNVSSYGEWSDPLTKATLLGIPGNLKIQAASDSLTVNWDGVQGASSYEVEADGKLIDNGLNTVFVHNDLGSNTKHTYRVRAKNDSGGGSGVSEWSQEISETTVPPVPASLAATAAIDKISLTWSGSTDASSYDLEVDGQIIAGISATSYTHSGLEPNTMHVYRVRAVRLDKHTEWSAAIRKITTPQITINVDKDTVFNFVVVAPKKEGITTRTVTVNYKADELEVLDLSALTPDLERAAGIIEGTNITVVEFSPGKIVYRIDHADKTVVNSIKFRSISSEYSKVAYTVE